MGEVQAVLVLFDQCVQAHAKTNQVPSFLITPNIAIIDRDINIKIIFF